MKKLKYTLQLILVDIELFFVRLAKKVIIALNNLAKRLGGNK